MIKEIKKKKLVLSTLCAETPSPPYISEPKPKLSKILEGLLMRLVIFVNTILQLNLLSITIRLLRVLFKGE